MIDEMKLGDGIPYAFADARGCAGLRRNRARNYRVPQDVGRLCRAVLPIVALSLLGCPHESDPDSPRLVGKYEAVDPRRTILRSRRLDFFDAHHLRTENGRTVEYTLMEEFFLFPGDIHDTEGNWTYSDADGWGYPGGILFVRDNPREGIIYRRLP